MGMSYLIDTHILLWWIFDSPQLYTTCRDIISNPDHCIFVSSASAWEIATKYRIGKLPEAKQLVEQYSQILKQAEFIELAITSAHAVRAGSLPIVHKDPFDRMIIAQAELENLPVITCDSNFPTALIRVIPNQK
jgi:PIN domain nuclease of toxin-antitoxin system